MSDDYEARSGCGPVGIAVLAIVLVLLIVLARKHGWAR